MTAALKERLERTRATPVYSIGAASRLTGLPAWTLRWVERNGLVRPARSDGRHRLFSDEDIERLQAIRELLEERVNVNGIRVLLRLGFGAGRTAGVKGGSL